MEPRYLLSGTPVQLTDHTTKTAANNAADGTKVAAELTSIIGKLSYLGQQIDKDSMLSKTAVPLINQTVNDLTGHVQSGATLGQFLFSNAGVASAIQTQITTLFANDTKSGTTTDVTSANLVTSLNSILSSDFGGDFTVTDNSTAAGELDLHFSYTGPSVTVPTNIVLGNAAQEFNLVFTQVAAGAPQATASLTITTAISFDIKADFSTAPADTTSVANELATYDAISSPTPTQTATLQSNLDSDFTFNPNQFEQTGLISEDGASAGGYLPAFGVQFGVMGAGENNAVDGAYASNATFNLDVDAQVHFNSASYTLATLTSAENTAASSGTPYTPYQILTPVGNSVAGSSSLTNEATLTLPINVYDDGQIGTGSPTQTNDSQFISGLGGVTGTFTISDANLFDGTTPLVSASSVELASFARLTAANIVSMAQNSSYLAAEIDSGVLTANLPFLNLTQGEAYDFATALQNAFVNAMENTQIVLTANNEPSTVDGLYPNGNPLNFSGTTTFKIALSTGSGASAKSYVLPVTITPINPASPPTTMAGLVDEINHDIGVALTAAGLSTNEIKATVRTNSAGTQLLQLYSNDTSAQFFLYGFPSTLSSGGLDLGFNQYGNVISQTGVGITGTAPATFQLPGVIVQSQSTGGTPVALDLSQFTSPVSFNVSVNGAPAVTVTIPSNAYSPTNPSGFIQAMQNALTSAHLWDGVSQNGVLVQAVTIGNGFGIEFYGGNDVYSLAFTDPGTVNGNASHFSALSLNAPTSTAPSFVLAVTNGGTNTTTTTTVHINGNLTNGLLNYTQANQTVTDLVSSIQRALVQAGVLNAAGTTGIGVSFTNDASGHPMLVFQAENPGTTTGTISSFTISSENGLGALLGTTTLSSQNIALSSSSTTPAFQTVQQLASLLYNLHYNGSTGLNSDNYFGVLAGAPSFFPGDLTQPNGTPSFTFPIDISVDDTSTVAGSSVLPDLSGVPLVFSSSYDDVSNLQSSSTVSVSRSDNLSFDFGVNLIAPVNPLEQLTASVPFTQLFTNYQLNTDAVLNIMVDTGVIYTVTIPAGSTTESNFLSKINAAIASATSNSATAPSLSSYLQAVTTSTDSSGETSLV
ncbi:MAG TPA: hypothetical protein VGC39_07450, partial [Candidatus Methylacidiphilales bacterium]